MARKSLPKTAAGAVFAILVAAVPIATVHFGLKAVILRLGYLEERMRELDSSLRRETEGVALLSRDAEAAIEKAGSRISRALARRDELVSDLVEKVDRLGRAASAERAAAERAASSGAAAGEADAGAAKDVGSAVPLAQDISLARALEEAERLSAAGRYGEAAKRYALVLAAAPGDPGFRRKRAVCLFRSNPADSSAYGFIEGELGAEPLGGSSEAAGASAVALEVLAAISVERQNWAKALEYFDRLIELRPRDSKALKEAGECALFAGDSPRARSYFDRACVAEAGDREDE